MFSLSSLERRVLFIGIALATFMMVLDYSIANIAIPYIAGDLAVSVDEGTYVITSFAVGNAIGLALTGWLSKRIGQIRLMTSSIALFTLFSIVCGLSFSLNMIVICRFIQGFVSGPIIPLSQSLLIKYGTPQSRAKDLAIWAMITITAPVFGPILGGYISDWYSWPWIFYINIPVGIFCMASIWFILRKDETETEKIPIDLLGIILLCIGVACLQIFLDKGQQWDWWNSLRIRTLSIAAVISFIYLVIREKSYKNPFMNLALFKIPSYSLSLTCLIVSYGIYFGTIVIVPLWLQENMGYNAENAGIAVSALGIAPVLFSITTPLLIKKIGNEKTLLLSFVIFCCACFYAAYFTPQVDLFHIAFSRFFFGFGMVWYISPLLGISVEEIPIHLLPQAMGIYHFFRAMIGAVGTSVFTTLWARRMIFHHHQIGSALTPYNPMTPQIKDKQSLALLNHALDDQASMMAINDAFFLMAWLFVFLVILLLGWIIWKKYRKRVPVSAKD